MSKFLRMFSSKKNYVKDGFDEAQTKSFDKYATFHPHALSLKQLLLFGKFLTSAEVAPCN